MMGSITPSLQQLPTHGKHAEAGLRPRERRALRAKPAASEALTRPSGPIIEAGATTYEQPERRAARPETMPTYTCLCCSHTEAFETAEDAFEASWDVAPYFRL